MKPLREKLERVEREEIDRALTREGGNVMAAARVLDMPLRTLYNRMLTLGIDPNRYRDSVAK